MSKKYKMTSAQKRLFAIDKMKGNNILYNIPIAFECNEKINEDNLKKAIYKVISNHDILKTYFTQQGSEFLQVVEEEPVLDFEILSIEEKEKYELDKLVQPFNLEELPLIRTKILNTEDKKSILFFDIHHIVFDGASLEPFFRDLSKAYNGEEFEKNKMQYVNYGSWMEKSNMEKERKYWKDKFKTFPKMTKFPLDYIPANDMSGKGEEIKTFLDQGIVEKISNTNKLLGVTNYIVTLGAFVLTLQRYISENEYAIVSPVSGRMHLQLENMIGMFVNTIILADKVDGNKSVKEFLEATRDVCLAAFDNQMFPYEKVLEDVQKQFEEKALPHANIMFSFQNGADYNIQLGETLLKEIEVKNNVSKFDLTLNIDKADDKFILHWEYNTHLFKKSRIERLAQHYETVLENMLADINMLVGNVSEVNGKERTEIIEVFNNTYVKYDNQSSWIDLFHESVEKYGDNIAIQFENKKLTYKELNTRANCVGEKLLISGIQKSDVVALSTSRSTDMIVGILGILKVGAVYLPIDKNQPIERLKYMLSSSGAKIILSNHDYNFDEIKTINLREIRKEYRNNLEVSTNAEDEMYIIFTSGSTGNPKGVRVMNKSVVNLSNWFKRDGGYNENTIIIQNFNYIFDGAVAEIFPTLLSGGMLLMLGNEERKSPELLVQYLPKAQITMVPSMFRSLLEYILLHPNDIKLLEQAERINLAAEKFEPMLLDSLSEKIAIPQFTMENNYGPTEATVCSTSYKIIYDKKYDKVPIGKPIDNTRIYIVKDHMLCGINIIGELWIAGDGLAKGYINQEETNKNFEESELVNERVYKTGDLGYWDEEGNIVYIGRSDNVVKINGFRIEKDEIVNSLLKMPRIREAVVIERTQKNNTKSELCVYFTAEVTMETKDVKEHLRLYLPEYMVPTYYMQMPEFTRNTSDKVDTSSLPYIFLQTDDITEPENETEEKVYNAFKETLDVEKFGTESSFFELGGDSLKALTLANNIEINTGKRLSIGEVLELQTVKKLSKRINTFENKVEKKILRKAKEII